MPLQISVLLALKFTQISVFPKTFKPCIKLQKELHFHSVSNFSASPDMLQKEKTPQTRKTPILSFIATPINNCY